MRDEIIGPGFLRTRKYAVAPGPHCPTPDDRELTDAHKLAFSLLCVRLGYIAGSVEPNEFGIRAIAFTKLVVGEDGQSDLAPLRVYFSLDAAGTTALILEFEKIKPSDAAETIVSDFVEVARREYRDVMKTSR
jgi:hypothetical protein